MASEVPIDAIKGDHKDLLPNCEWALRHIDEEEYYTSDEELKYLHECLKGIRLFSESDHDEAINGINSEISKT